MSSQGQQQPRQSPPVVFGESGPLGIRFNCPKLRIEALPPDWVLPSARRQAGRPAKLAERRVGLVRLRTAAAVHGFLQRAEAGKFVNEHKPPKRCNKEGVVGRRISLPPAQGESKNKSPLLARPRPTGLPQSST